MEFSLFPGVQVQGRIEFELHNDVPLKMLQPLLPSSCKAGPRALFGLPTVSGHCLRTASGKTLAFCCGQGEGAEELTGKLFRSAAFSPKLISTSL